MSAVSRAFIASLLLLSAPASAATASGAGGVSGDDAGTHAASGGAKYGATLRTLPGRPSIRSTRLVAAKVQVGARAHVRVLVRRRAAKTVVLRVVVRRRHGVARVAHPGRVTTGSAQTVALPAWVTRSTGRYTLRVVVHPGAGASDVRGGLLPLTVAPKPKPKPAPVTPTPAPAPVVAGGVFPVQGAFSFGGADGRFGAGREGHTHEGQDIVAAEGLPVVAPVAGEVLFNDYQAHAAGRYIVLHADDGRDMFFAHCQAGSADAKPGQRVAAGGHLCNVGATGDASGPHLHFEIWPQGWRQIKGTRPVDPLPQLRAWAGQ